jgi:hypothetical protein
MNTNTDGVSAMSAEFGQPLERTEVRRVTLLESDLSKLVCSGQLSKTSRFTLQVDGPFGDREARALMHLLGVQMEVLNTTIQRPSGPLE